VRSIKLPSLGTSIATPRRAGESDSSIETREATHYVLGGAHVGVAIARRLRAAGHRVAVVDEGYDSDEIPGFAGDPAATDTLVESGVSSASTAIVVTPSDRRNLLIAQLVRARFDVPRIVVFVNDPDQVSLFADAGHEPFCVTTALSETFGGAV
jgi:Trk K+ transport system NAD-binding subunit